MSNDYDASDESNDRQEIRRIQVLFRSGVGHQFVLLPGDQLIDPLLPPEGWPEDQVYDPKEGGVAQQYIDRPRLIIVRENRHPDVIQSQDTIWLDDVAWIRYDHVIEKKRKAAVSPPSVMEFRGSQNRKNITHGERPKPSEGAPGTPVKISNTDE